MERQITVISNLDDIFSNWIIKYFPNEEEEHGYFIPLPDSTKEKFNLSDSDPTTVSDFNTFFTNHNVEKSSALIKKIVKTFYNDGPDNDTPQG